LSSKKWSPTEAKESERKRTFNSGRERITAKRKKKRGDGSRGWGPQHGEIVLRDACLGKRGPEVSKSGGGGISRREWSRRDSVLPKGESLTYGKKGGNEKNFLAEAKSPKGGGTRPALPDKENTGSPCKVHKRGEKNRV